MQEEIEHKTVNFAISTVKLSARTLLKGAQFFLRQYDKSASQGKQSMNRLIRQNRGVTNLEIEKTGIKDFDRCAKRYHIDYAIQKDLSCTPPRFLIFFKAQDLVFFKGTYDTPGMSHTGIYLGNGMMVSAGDPIKYANIHSSYWQKYLSGFGRLSK